MRTITSLSLSEITGELENIHRARPSIAAFEEDDPEAVRAIDELNRRERAFLLELEERRLRQQGAMSLDHGL